MRPVALSLVAFAFLTACGTDPDRSGASAEHAPVLAEIPPGAGIPVRSCRDGDGYFANTALADREGWYGKHLRVLGEYPFCARGGVTPVIYRLTWLPSFHPSVVVRVERSLAGDSLTAKVETGAGGYEPGHLARDTSYVLSETDAREFTVLLNAARFWELPTEPPPDGTAGLDGAQWVLEGSASGRYHVVDRWSPSTRGRDAQYRRLAEWMLARSGMASRELVREY